MGISCFNGPYLGFQDAFLFSSFLLGSTWSGFPRCPKWSVFTCSFFKTQSVLESFTRCIVRARWATHCLSSFWMRVLFLAMGWMSGQTILCCGSVPHRCFALGWRNAVPAIFLWYLFWARVCNPSAGSCCDYNWAVYVDFLSKYRLNAQWRCSWWSFYRPCAGVTVLMVLSCFVGMVYSSAGLRMEEMVA